jgi:catechol 1,2-dioxygenase
MRSPSRRKFLHTSLSGLAAAAVGTLSLRADAQPTPPSGDLGAYGDYLRQHGEAIEHPRRLPAVAPPTGPLTPTEPDILGPFYRQGAPFRGKLTAPLEPGEVLLIRGRVWGHDTRQPLPGAVLDLWQANRAGRYDNDDPRRPPRPDLFANRARLRCDETGYYEYETIHPGPYLVGPNAWRPPHIHYLVRCEGYRQLVTQLYFKGDPHQAADPFIKPSLTIDLQTITVQQIGRPQYRVGTFDIVLAPV